MNSNFRLQLPNSIELVFNSRGEGHPLILVSGMNSQLIHWPEGFVDQLAGRGFRVLRYDHRDLGQSTHLKDQTSIPSQLARLALGLPVTPPYTLHEMAQDLALAMDQLGLSDAHIVGFSMGGMIAQVLALEFPERVRSLTLMSTNCGEIYLPRVRALYAMARAASRSRRQAIEAEVAFLRTISGPESTFDEALVRSIAAQAWDRDPYPTGGPRHFLACLATPNRRDALRHLRIPTRVIHGVADPLIPYRAGVDLAATIPEADLHLIEELGHSLPREFWHRFSNLISTHAINVDDRRSLSRDSQRLLTAA